MSRFREGLRQLSIFFFRVRQAFLVQGLARFLWVAPPALVYSRYTLFVVDLEEDERDEGEQASKGLESRRTKREDRGFRDPKDRRPRALTVEDHKMLAALDVRWNHDEIDRRLADGLSCFVWEEGSQIAHVRWMALGEAYLSYLGGRVVCPQSCAVSVEALTPRRFRHQGLFRESFAWALWWARRQRCRHMLFAAAWWNDRIVKRAVRDTRTRRIGSVEKILGVRRSSGSVTMRAADRFEVNLGRR